MNGLYFPMKRAKVTCVLPAEIFEEIFFFAYDSTLLDLMCSCQFFRAIVDRREFWKNKKKIYKKERYRQNGLHYDKWLVEDAKGDYKAHYFLCRNYYDKFSSAFDTTALQACVEVRSSKKKCYDFFPHAQFAAKLIYADTNKSGKLFSSQYGGSPFLPLGAEHPLCDICSKRLVFILQAYTAPIKSTDPTEGSAIPCDILPGDSLLQLFCCSAGHQDVEDVEQFSIILRRDVSKKLAYRPKLGPLLRNPQKCRICDVHDTSTTLGEWEMDCICDDGPEDSPYAPRSCLNRTEIGILGEYKKLYHISCGYEAEYSFWNKIWAEIQEKLDHSTELIWNLVRGKRGIRQNFVLWCLGASEPLQSSLPVCKSCCWAVFRSTLFPYYLELTGDMSCRPNCMAGIYCREQYGSNGDSHQVEFNHVCFPDEGSFEYMASKAKSHFPLVGDLTYGPMTLFDVFDQLPAAVDEAKKIEGLKPLCSPRHGALTVKYISWEPTLDFEYGFDVERNFRSLLIEERSVAECSGMNDIEKEEWLYEMYDLNEIWDESSNIHEEMLSLAVSGSHLLGYTHKYRENMWDFDDSVPFDEHSVCGKCTAAGEKNCDMTLLLSLKMSDFGLQDLVGGYNAASFLELYACSKHHFECYSQNERW